MDRARGRARQEVPLSARLVGTTPDRDRSSNSEPLLVHVEVADGVRGRDGLTPRMRAATRGLAETLFTTEEGPPPASRLDWLVDDLDHFFRHAGKRARFLYRACLLAVSVIAPLLVFRPPPFRGMPQAERMRALDRMERGAFGLAVFGAKAVLCILYYEHPDAARAIGYDESCLGPLR